MPLGHAQVLSRQHPHSSEIHLSSLKFQSLTIEERVTPSPIPHGLKRDLSKFPQVREAANAGDPGRSKTAAVVALWSGREYRGAGGGDGGGGWCAGATQETLLLDPREAAEPGEEAMST